MKNPAKPENPNSQIAKECNDAINIYWEYRRLIRRAVLIFFVAFTNTEVIALEGDAYECVVGNTSVILGDGGELSRWTFRQGEKFIVDKQSGRMLGALSNHNAFGNPKVIDRGSEDQAYKVITVFEPFTEINVLYVQEFRDGENKPFSFTDGGRTYTGLCKEY